MNRLCGDAVLEDHPVAAVSIDRDVQAYTRADRRNRVPGQPVMTDEERGDTREPSQRRQRLQVMVPMDDVGWSSHGVEVSDNRNGCVTQLLGQRAGLAGKDDRQMAAAQQRQCEIARIHRRAGSRGQGDRGDQNATRFGYQMAKRSAT